MKPLCTFLLIGALSAANFATPTAADPLMGNKAWSPAPNSSRASIASLMLQKEQGNPDSYAGAIFTCGGSGSGGAGGEGGGAGGNTTSSTATANNNCVIITGSKGTVVDADQISNGNQSSSSSSGSTSSTASNGVSESSLSEILDSMN